MTTRFTDQISLDELKEMEEKRIMNRRRIIKIGIGCFIVGIFLILFFVGFKPAFQKYVADKQQEAYTFGIAYTQNFMLSEIAKSLSTKGYVQITFPDNQTIFLAPINPGQGGIQ